LKVHFIDVGQGDSILIDLNDQEILIDGGEKSSGVTSYISSYVDGPLEAVIATHPHSDHIGGLISVLNSFDVLNIWTNGDSTNSQTYSEFMSAIQSEHANTYVVRRGDKINVGGLSFTVLNPDTLNGTTNNNSIVLSLSYGDIDFLFTGDAEKEAEASMLVSSVVPVPDVEILKVGHHGSRTASSHDFLAATSPEVAIYMAGKGNSYGHPHEETITALNGIGAEIYGTDVHGTIVVATDGEAYTLQLEKQAPPYSPSVISPTPEPSTPVEGAAIGKSAPNFQFNNAHEQPVSLADFRGKPILLNFWATWCSPCRAELPYIQKVYDKWSEYGLVVLAVNMGESPSKVEEFMKSHNFSFPVLLDSKRSLADKYNIRYIPTTYFIDDNGVIKHIKIGAFSGVAEIEDMINNILP